MATRSPHCQGAEQYAAGNGQRRWLETKGAGHEPGQEGGEVAGKLKLKGHKAKDALKR
jgi:hypothetical protein